MAMHQPGAVALWHCCACGREWRAEGLGLGDDTECCPFAPKMLAFGATSAWGKHSVDPETSDEAFESTLFSKHVGGGLHRAIEMRFGPGL